jgi:hypothetical protein
MIRDNGKRRAQAGLLVPVIELVGDMKSAAGGSRFFDLKGVFRGGKQWRIDFQNALVVDLSVLDLAVFNRDGSVQLSREHAAPAIALADGWTRRLNRAKKELFPPDGDPVVSAIAIGQRAARLKGVLDGDSIKYPLRRIGRLESTTATAILAAWATFQTRAALDYDFAKSSEAHAPATTEPTAGVGKAELLTSPDKEPATRAVPETVTVGQAEPAKVAVTEPAAPARTETAKVRSKAEADSGASASPPSGG